MNNCKLFETARIRLLKGEIFKKLQPQPYYIEVQPGCIYQTTPMETLLLDFDRKAYKFKAIGIEEHHL